MYVAVLLSWEVNEFINFDTYIGIVHRSLVVSQSASASHVTSDCSCPPYITRVSGWFTKAPCIMIMLF